MASLRSTAVRAAPWAGPLLALCLYFGVIWHYARNAPFQDDYHAILDSAVKLREGGGLVAYLFTPHNEHLIAFGHAVSGLQLALLGRLQLEGLILIGNLCLPALFLCWRASFPELRRDPFAQATAALLLIQLRYWESSTWAMTSLASFPVLLFAWISVLVLERRRGLRAFAVAAAAALLAVLSQGNGVLIFAPGALLLAAQRRQAALAGWVALGAGAAAALVGLRIRLGTGFELPAAAGRDLASALAFFLSFLGSIWLNMRHAAAFGVLLAAAVLACALARRLERRGVALAIFGFVLLSAAAATATRIDVGQEHVVVPRYAIYSSVLVSLLVGCAWPRAAQGRRRIGVPLALASAALAANLALLESALPRLRARAFRLDLLHAQGQACERYAFRDQRAAEQILSRALALGLLGRGFEHPPPLARCERFAPRILPRSAGVAAALRVDGGVDSVRVDGASLRISGWAPVPDAAIGRQLAILTDLVPRDLTLRTQARPEVAVARRNPELQRAGFALRLRFASRRQAERALAQLCLAAGDAERLTALLPLAPERCREAPSAAEPTAALVPERY